MHNRSWNFLTLQLLKSLSSRRALIFDSLSSVFLENSLIWYAVITADNSEV